MNVMMGNIGGLVVSWLFLFGDGFDYYIGNGFNFVINGMVFLFSLVILFWMKKDNKVRDCKDID